MSTEELIKAKAKEIFFTKGHLHATTQDIADAAEVNRSLINYYFRSRDQLFQTVYREAVEDLKSQLDVVFYADIPFKEKVEQFIEVYMKELLRYPYRESFLITEICSNNFALKEKKKSEAMHHFLKDIEQASAQGIIKPCKPVHFLFNLFSLMALPVIMRPLYQKLLDINDLDYNQLINERKALILKLIFD